MLNDVELEIKAGELIGICGQVGSGKTSLLSALLGDMRLVSTGQRQENELIEKVVNLDGKLAFCQ